jgi:hypothetical protein
VFASAVAEFSGADVLTLGLAGLGFASLVAIVELSLAKRRFKSFGG